MAESKVVMNDRQFLPTRNDIENFDHVEIKDKKDSILVAKL